MKQMLSGVLSLLFLMIVILAQAPQAFAEDQRSSITIVKYKLTEADLAENPLPIDGTKIEKAVNKEGKTFEPLSGVSYEITRVSPVNGTTQFEPVQGTDAFSKTITTDNNGQARLSDLVQGTYRVIEKAQDQIKEPMEPVILELPLPQRSGQSLNDVYLYPKSSIAGATVIDPKEITTEKGTSPERIPQTSGTIGSYSSFYVIIIFLTLMGFIGIRMLRSKKHYY
ncbi:pilin N-terminal domain-containing protein [Candidatus Enterococcus murrayae]|uniref:Cell wall protein n=1 Tax=Candidatus Enterococcus murrayae TaxID=2815321 RepID=A0ABS3HBV5_9ENTE|nr:pilin N-terminal domain-containing protein [Enterococcus sp. MJM16]MBO0450935.1 cell wall protein [Enterococcus sp. MJM16]